MGRKASQGLVLVNPACLESLCKAEMPVGFASYIHDLIYIKKIDPFFTLVIPQQRANKLSASSGKNKTKKNRKHKPPPGFHGDLVQPSCPF